MIQFAQELGAIGLNMLATSNLRYYDKWFDGGVGLFGVAKSRHRKAALLLGWQQKTGKEWLRQEGSEWSTGV